MVAFLKRIYKLLLYGYKGSSKQYINYLRKRGVVIGQNVTFYEPNTNYVDVQKPYQIVIGNNVEITRGVTIIAHDYAWSVIKQISGEIIGSRKGISIGNNVFIGVNSIILQGVTIGDNVIIGANTLVNKDVSSGSVVAGNPIRKISSLEQYIMKRKTNYLQDAKDLFKNYYYWKKEIPSKIIFDEFFWLFEKRDIEGLPETYIEKLKLTGNYEDTLHQFVNSKPLFNGYDEFVKYCMREINCERFTIS
ncbi:MAG: acyltransferase [Lachnospiraceae bacterium]|nr:acyltransferase [Lachnospiraceae bacterium]